jgi:antitoxin component HigA of HigAB toxin-antitoxin module
MKENKSEQFSRVAQLRQQIAEELEAMQRGFSAYAAGVARHDFIRARMEQIGNHQEELAANIGSDDAANIVCELYIDKITGKDKA